MHKTLTQWNARFDDTGVPLGYDHGQDEAQALIDGLAMVYEGTGDRLRLTGGDALDLLHRLAASEVRQIPPDEWRPLLLTSDKGKVIDHAQLVRHDDHLDALCGARRGADVKAWIDRFIITEDVALESQNEAVQLWLVGDAAALRAAEQLQTPALDGDWAFRSDVAGNLLLSAGPRWPRVARLSLSAKDAPRLLLALQDQGVVPVGQEAFDAWRIPHGRVMTGGDLTLGVNPLEAGLHDVVSFTKGCYVGQEVVARLDTYEKVRRALAVMDVAGTTRAGDDVTLAGKVVGKVLASAANTALALVPKNLEPGSSVEAGAQPARVRMITPA